jgi:hypothetical protein
MRTVGTFTLDSWEPEPIDDGPGAALGRVRITKTFSGELVGTSTVEMLTAVSGVEGSAAYVAFERIFATLGDRSGSFVLHHSATSSAAGQVASWTVVPDSGAGDLVGITGSAAIDVAEDGTHTFTLDYALPE